MEPTHSAFKILEKLNKLLDTELLVNSVWQQLLGELRSELEY